jgi:cation transport ATPase
VKFLGLIGYREKVHKGAQEFISFMKDIKCPVSLLSGDNYINSLSTACRLNILSADTNTLDLTNDDIDSLKLEMKQ